MTAPEPKVSDTLQKSLTKDLASLQTRLEKFEDLLLTLPPEDAAKCWEQINHYREETKRVRTSVLQMHDAVMSEIQR